MSSSFKRTYYKPTTTGMDVAYTVPSVSSAVILSAIATPTNAEDKTVSVGVAPTGSTDINWISKNVQVYNGSSINLIPDRVALNTGDRIVVNSNTDLMQFVTPAASLVVTSPTSIATNTSGSIIVVGGTDGLAMSSDGGLSFTKVSAVAPVNSGFNLLRYFNSKFIYFVSSATIYTSTDGVTWTANTQGSFSNAVYPTSQVTGNSTRLVGINNGVLYESTNGTTWTTVATNGYPVNMKTNQEININFVYWSSTTGFYACGDNGTVFRCSNTPGSNQWAQVPTGVLDNLYGMFYSSQLYIVGDNGRIISTSTFNETTSTFSSITTPTTESLRAITFNGSYWIACGTNGTILTSTSPSSTWTARTSGVSVTLNAVTSSAPNNALVVGDTGTILYENNTSGATWVSKTSGTSENLNGALWSASMSAYVVVGNTGTVLTANSAATTWTSKTSGTSNHLYSITQSASTFGILIAGAAGTILGIEQRYGLFNFATLKSGTTSNIKSIFSTGTINSYAVYVGSSGLFGMSSQEFTSSPVSVPSYVFTDMVSGTSTKFNYIAMATTGSNLVAVGDTGIIYTSTTTTLNTWTARTSGVSVNLNSVVQNSSGVWVVVGDTGTILTSSDLITWTSRTSSTTNNLNGVCLGPGTPSFVAVGNGGVIRTGDATGVTWTSQTNADTANLRAVAFNSSSTNWVAVGDGGRALLGTTSATTWAVQTSNTSNNLRAINWATTLNYVAVGDSGTIITGVAAGTSWSVRQSGTAENLYTTIINNSNVVGLSPVNSITGAAFGDNGCMITSASPSSFNYTTRKTSITTVLYGCADTGSVTVAVGASGKIYTISVVNGGFQESYVLRPTDIPSISSSTNFAVAAGPFSTMYTSGLTSSTNRWNTLFPTASVPESQFRKAIFNGTSWMFVGTSGSVMTLSSNAQTGTPTFIATQTGTNFRSGIWSTTNTQHILVGDEGGIFTSTNATNLMTITKRTSGTTQDLNDIATRSSLYVVVGNGGTILTSTNSGVTWTSQTSGTSENLLGISYNSTLDIFIAVGTNGTILTGNTTGTTWTARTSGTTKNLNGVFFANGNVPVAVGDSGTILYSSVASAGATWTSVTPVVDYDLLSGCTLPSSTQNYITGKGYTILDVTTITAPVIRSSYTPICTITSGFQNANNNNKAVFVGTNGMVFYGLGRQGTSMFAPRFSGTYSNLNDITSTAIGNTVFVAAGDNGTIIQCTVVSGPAGQTSWSFINSSTTDNLYGVGTGSTTNCVAVGAGGRIVYGSPAQNSTWTVATSNTSNRLNSVSALSSSWAAVGVSGTIVTATTEAPSSWTVRSSGTTETFNSVRNDATNGSFIAIGNAGTIRTSSNASPATWTVRTSGVTTDLTDIGFLTTASITSVVVGKSGVYLVSTDSINWTQYASGTTNDISVVSLGASNLPVYIDSANAIYGKDTVSSAAVLLSSPKAATSQVSQSNATLISYATPIGTTSYTVYLGLPGKTIASRPQTSTTAVTDITSVGDSGSTTFFVCQTTGNVRYTSDFVTMTDLGVTGLATKTLGNRVIVGSDNVISLPQSTVIASAATTNSVSFGPTLTSSSNYDRYSNTIIGLDSSGNYWKIDDATSAVPRGGLQFVVSTTEIV